MSEPPAPSSAAPSSAAPSSPVPSAALRVGDAERQAVADVLGVALREGRLAVDEYHERLTAAYAARTRGELAVLTGDLPVPAAAPVVPTEDDDEEDLGEEWRTWLGVGAIVWTIYLVTAFASGGLFFPWPLWVVGPWGAWLLVQTVTSRRDRR